MDDHEKKMMRWSRLQYLNDDSDFAHLNVVEFETWKGERGLHDKDLTSFTYRRRELERLCKAHLAAYQENILSLEGSKGLIRSLREICGPNDQALFGKTIWEALKHISAKKEGPSKSRIWLKRQIAFFLDYLENEKSDYPTFNFSKSIVRNGKEVIYPGKNKEDRIHFILDRYEKMDLQKLVPSSVFIKEIIRPEKISKKG